MEKLCSNPLHIPVFISHFAQVLSGTGLHHTVCIKYQEHCRPVLADHQLLSMVKKEESFVIKKLRLQIKIPRFN